MRKGVIVLCSYWWCLGDGYTCRHGAVVGRLECFKKK